MSTQQGSCGSLYHTTGSEFRIMVFRVASDVLMLHKSQYYLMDSTGISVWCESRPAINDKYFNKPLVSASICFSFLCFLLNLFPSFSIPPFFFVSDVWWTQRMSSATSSQSRCPQRCATGWHPPSPARWAWCCDAMKKNLASAASSMPFRLAYLLRGKHVCDAEGHNHNHTRAPSGWS